MNQPQSLTNHPFSTFVKNLLVEVVIDLSHEWDGFGFTPVITFGKVKIDGKEKPFFKDEYPHIAGIVETRIEDDLCSNWIKK